MKNFEEKIIQNKMLIKIASHHAPIFKLKQYFENSDSIFYKKKFDIIECNSTSLAAEMVRYGKVDFCLTNEEAVKKYNLKFITQTTKIDMTWSLFGYKKLIPLFMKI